MTSSPSSVFFIFLLVTLLLTVSSDLNDEDKKALLNFMDKVGNESKITWDREGDSCKWFGVMCDPTNSSVIYLLIAGARLIGKIPPDSLGKITSLRVLSLHHNKLSGEFPDDFDNLLELRRVYLYNNNFSGPFPSSVAKWTKLRSLDLSGNKFSGPFPSSVTTWTKLLALDLSGNNFHGMLPDNVPPSIGLNNFNVSYNNFIGPIPKNLTKFPVAAFSGNIYLCNDTNLPPCKDTVISQQSQAQVPLDSPSLNHKKEEKLCTPAIVVIAVGSALILLLLLSYLRKEWIEARQKKNEPGVATKATEAAAAAKGFEKVD